MALFMRLKGKQVRNLYDLVTVSKEYGSVCIKHDHWETGKIEPYVDSKSGNLPVVWYGNIRFQITSNWSYRFF